MPTDVDLVLGMLRASSGSLVLALQRLTERGGPARSIEHASQLLEQWERAGLITRSPGRLAPGPALPGNEHAPRGA